MKGLEIAEAFYNTYGKKMIHDNFLELENKITIGLVGSGSECLGFDDDLSKDHDYEPRFIMFVPDETDRQTFFKLERAYNALPKEFMGLQRKYDHLMLGDSVIKISDFYLQKVGNKDGNLSNYEWLSLPSFYLLEATNGKIFNPVNNDFIKIREKLSKYPEDIKFKKLAGNLLLMYQSGIYNYERAITRKDLGAVSLSLHEFTKHTLAVLYLLNDIYMPYYKWWFKGLEKFFSLTDLLNKLKELLVNDTTTIFKRTELISFIVELVLKEIKSHNVIKVNTSDLSSLAYQVNNMVKDNALRNLNILAGVN